MDAVALAKEFAEDCLIGKASRGGLRDWLEFNRNLFPLTDDDLNQTVRLVTVALDSKIIITIK